MKELPIADCELRIADLQKVPCPTPIALILLMPP